MSSAPNSKPGPSSNPAPKIAQGAGNVVPDSCTSVACKAKAKRFGFCDEHYEHFKFGLIKKNGQPVPDYEKKLDHFKKLPKVA